jgi:hypothetical protein
MYLQKTSPSGDLVKQEELLYGLSKQFSILNDGELYDVMFCG